MTHPENEVTGCIFRPFDITIYNTDDKVYVKKAGSKKQSQDRMENEPMIPSANPRLRDTGTPTTSRQEKEAAKPYRENNDLAFLTCHIELYKHNRYLSRETSARLHEGSGATPPGAAPWPS